MYKKQWNILYLGARNWKIKFKTPFVTLASGISKEKVKLPETEQKSGCQGLGAGDTGRGWSKGPHTDDYGLRTSCKTR